MFVCGRMDEGGLPVGEARMSILGLTFALVKEYRLSAGRATGKQALDDDDREMRAEITLTEELPEGTIHAGDILYLTVSAAPRVSIRLDAAEVADVYTEEHFAIKVLEHNIHPVVGDSAGQTAYVEHMAFARKMQVSDGELSIYHRYEALRKGPYGLNGKSHEEAIAILAREDEISQEAVESAVANANAGFERAGRRGRGRK